MVTRRKELRVRKIVTAPEQAATRVQSLVGEPRAFKPRSMARKRGLLLAQSQLYLEARLLGSHMFIRMSQWNSPGKNTGVDCHSLFQGIFPTQGLSLQADCLPSELPGTHKSFLRLRSLKMKAIKLLSDCEIILFSPKLDF